MLIVEAAQLLITSVADWAKTLAGGTVPALVVYGITKRDVNTAKAHSLASREEAKKEFTEAIGPALKVFKHELTSDLLQSIDGTYLRSAESRIHFETIKKSISRLEASVDGILDRVTNPQRNRRASDHHD